jgi:hypothetical protein
MVGGSNPRPPHCERGALPAELTTHSRHGETCRKIEAKLLLKLPLLSNGIAWRFILHHVDRNRSEGYNQDQKDEDAQSYAPWSDLFVIARRRGMVKAGAHAEEDEQGRK